MANEKKRKIKAVLSDLGNVLVPFDNTRTHRAFARMAGIAPAQAEAAFDHGLLVDYELGTVSTEEFRQRVCEALGIYHEHRRPENDAFDRAYCDVFDVDPVVRSVWRSCAASGVTLVAVSNICPLRHEWLRRIGELDLFHHQMASYEHQLRKPSEELMVRALAAAGVKAEEAIFLDDIAGHLVPAAELGIRTHHYVGHLAGHESFLAFLEECGL